MKINIKLITIFGIILSFSSAHIFTAQDVQKMVNSIQQQPKRMFFAVCNFHQIIDKKELNNAHSILDIEELLPKQRRHVKSHLINEYDSNTNRPFFYLDTTTSVERFDQTNRPLALHLAAIKAFEESKQAKIEEALKIISDAVSNGISVNSLYTMRPGVKKMWIEIYRSQKPVSIFTTVDDWSKNKWFSDNRKNAILSAIFQGEHIRKEKKEQRACTREELQTKTLAELVPIITGYLVEFDEPTIDKASIKCIEQAK